MSNGEIAKKREDKIKDWFKNPWNQALVLIILVAIGIRLFYFVDVHNQTLWWDEAEYMSTAKHWAFDVPYNLNPQRPPLFQFLASIIFTLGFNELLIRILLVVIPSVILVYVIYLLGKEMYDEKIGLIAAFLAAVSWNFIFWTNRVQPDFLSMTFSVLSILFMWKYWKNPSTKLIIYSGVFAALGFMFKVSGLLVPLFFFVFMIIKDRFEMFKKKDYYYFAITFFVSLLPQFLWSLFTFKDLFAFRTGYSNEVINQAPLGWYNFKFYYFLTQGLTFVLFIIGLIIAIRFLLYIDIMIKEKKRAFNPDLFSILVFVIVSAFYIFWVRGTDDRWVFLWMPFIFFIAGAGIKFIYSKLEKYNKVLVFILIFAVLGFAAYQQINLAGQTIYGKSESYAPVREAGLWLKENAEKDDQLLSISYTQSVYYSELNVSTYSDDFKNSTSFDSYVNQNQPEYLQVSLFEPHPPWIYEWIEANQDKLTPVFATFNDPEKTSPNLVVYKITYS